MPSKHKSPKKMASKASGSILIAVIISCAVLLILLGTLASFAELLQSQSGRQIRDFQASYLAEAGVNYVIATKAITAIGPTLFSLPNSTIGKISYSISDDPAGSNFKYLYVRAGVPQANPLTCRTVTVVTDSTKTIQPGHYDLSASKTCDNNNW